MTGAAATTIRHLRPRGDGATQPTTTVELFFDLVYVFAVTQLSHQIIDDLSVAGVARAAFLLLVVWWAWICTTWMANWFDPASPAVRGVLTAVMLGSLLMAAALPEAFGERGLLFAASYVALQVGRNVAAARLLTRRHRLRDVFERLVVWSAASGVLWLAGAALDGDQRLMLWIPALALELAAPAAGYWLPGRGRAATTDYDIEGTPLRRALPTVHHHRARRIDRGHWSDRLRCGTHIDGRALPRSSRSSRPRRCGGCTSARRPSTRAPRCAPADDPGRLARDAYTYLHLPIVAGIIATAVGNDLLIAEPHHALHGVGLAMMLGGPALFLLGESLFRWRMTGTTNVPRAAVAGFLILLVPIGGQVSALLAGVIVATRSVRACGLGAAGA